VKYATSASLDQQLAAKFISVLAAFNITGKFVQYAESALLGIPFVSKRCSSHNKPSISY